MYICALPAYALWGLSALLGGANLAKLKLTKKVLDSKNYHKGLFGHYSAQNYNSL
jgi:hypothetical protein